jgi:carbamoyltransferase
VNILGLIAVDVSGHPSACLLQDGKLVALAEEERFVRVKQARGYFPVNAVRYCLDHAGIGLDDIDVIAFGWDAERYRWRFPMFLARSFVRQKLTPRRVPRAAPPAGRPRLGSAVIAGIRSLVSFQPRTLREHIVLGLRDAGFVSGRIPPIVFTRHHLAHAASAFYSSGFEESAILVFDGHGEENTTSIFRGRGKDIELIEHIDIPHSLGWFYSAFTEFLGWNPNEGETKLMGLAPFGKPNPALEELVDDVLELTGDGYRINADYLFYGPRSYGKFFSDALVARLGPPRAPRAPLTDAHRDLAWAVQDRLERAGIHLARRAVRLAGSKNLCLAGGVALNCKMNGAINDAGVAEGLFVQPLSYDGGVSLGAAQLVSMEKGEDCRFEMDHLYWGPGFSDDEIEAALRLNQVPYHCSPDIVQETARLIAAGKIVGWFQGRLECGPRALGGRSILADPRDPGMKDRVNDRVKFREEWRPFALSILEEHFAEYVEKPTRSPFMILAFRVREAKRNDIPSAIHGIDHSTRPQEVSKRTHPLYWELLEAFRQRTGVPGVLNTSFNVKGEPIVCSPNDALRCFYGTGMDALAIGNFVVEKVPTGAIAPPPGPATAAGVASREPATASGAESREPSTAP